VDFLLRVRMSEESTGARSKKSLDPDRLKKRVQSRLRLPQERRREIMIDRRTNSTLWDLVSYQQETFQRVVATTMNAYVSLLRVPLAFTQAEENATEAARQQATEAAIEQVKQLAANGAQQATKAA
jgi:hypothetical protein